MVYRLYSSTSGTVWAADQLEQLMWFEQYGTSYAPAPPHEIYASGYLPRYQKRQLVGYHSASGDLRSVEVNASGHVLTDIEVEVSSGLFVQVQSGIVVASGLGVLVSGQSVLISGQHVFVESGVVIASGAAIISVISQGEKEDGQANVVNDTTYGALVVYPTDSWATRASGAGVLTQTPQSIHINAPSNPQVIGSTSGGDILTSGNINSITIKSLTTNSGDIYVGGHTVGHMPYSGVGYQLEPGNSVIINIQEIGYVHMFAEVSGDKAAYLGT